MHKTLGVTHATSRRVLCTPYNHAPWHFMQSHIRKVHAWVAVTCHLHFWQNDRDRLRVTPVGGNEYRNKSQHRKLTLEKKILSRSSCWDSNPRSFNHESSALTIAYFCRDKDVFCCTCLSRREFCRDKNDTCGSSPQCWKRCYVLSTHS